MDLKKSIKTVQIWAAEKRLINKVEFFGSRIKGTNRPDSDIDIAITLVYDDPNTCLAYWMENQECWQAELEMSFPWKVDLQFHHASVPGIVVDGVNECSCKVFERDAEPI